MLRDASGAAVDASTVSSAAATAPLPVISIMVCPSPTDGSLLAWRIVTERCRRLKEVPTQFMCLAFLESKKSIKQNCRTAAPALANPQFVQGADAYAAKVEFPKGEALDRTVIVGSMNPQVTLEQVSAGRKYPVGS